VNKRDDDGSDYTAHVAAAMDSYERAGDRDIIDPVVEIGQGIISSLLAIAAAIREENENVQPESGS
jgi:hypothetical protein